jgi:hypothetical protein
LVLDLKVTVLQSVDAGAGIDLAQAQKPWEAAGDVG